MNKLITEQSDWDELIDIISDKALTPVIGKEMFAFKENGSMLSVDAYISKQLFEQNRITDHTAASLSQAVDYLEFEKKQKTMDVIRKLKSIVKDISFDFPILDQFLQIKDLNYYINTAVYNNVLEKKILETRNKAASSINFSLNEPFTDSVDLEKLTEPFVFNVFGSLLTTIDPALSEEDLLEYTGHFKEKMSGATNIVSALKNKHLLFLGCTFPEWMKRFSLRLLSNEPMHEWGDRRSVIIINDNTEYRNRLIESLKNYEVVTYTGSTAEFVNELVAQWKKRNPNTVKGKSIFLSYARNDKPAVENLRTKIEQLGNITCWYDKEELGLGDNWRQRIVDGIRKADLFMPFISETSLKHEEGFVQKEWWDGVNESIRRTADKIDGKFIVPVVIDDSPLYGDNISKHFDPKINITKVPQGNPDEKFLKELKEILNLV